MRHRKGFNHLGRTSSHRKAMLSNMACSLIMHKRITTTIAKAKALRAYVEPLITRSKDDSTHARRMVFSSLQNKEAVSELFREVAVKVGDRPGGYTRILKMGNRMGDNADMCLIELVDYNESLLGKEDSKQKSSRRRRTARKKSDKPEIAAADTVAAEPAPAEEIPVSETPEETLPEETEPTDTGSMKAETETVKVVAGTEDSSPSAETEEPLAEDGDEEKKEDS